jgi:hypothetical protein
MPAGVDTDIPSLNSQNRLALRIITSFQVQIDETPATSKILGRQDVHGQIIWFTRTLHMVKRKKID